MVNQTVEHENEVSHLSWEQGPGASGSESVLTSTKAYNVQDFCEGRDKEME